MKARTIIELLTLSSNLYLIAKDKELMDELSDLAKKGKDKFGEFMDDNERENSPFSEILHKMIDKAKEAKVELEERVEEIAAELYKKMHIAHVNEIKLLNKRIEFLEKRIEACETMKCSSNVEK